MEQPGNAVKAFDKYAREYQEKFMDVSIYSEGLNLFCKMIPKQNAPVLELACGPGNISKYILDKRPDLELHGTDLAPNMIELARKNNPRARFSIMDCREIGSLKEKFDAIVCGFCLPYLSLEETSRLISDSAAILNEKGSIYISTIQGDYEHSGLRLSSKGDEIFMYYYDEILLRSLLSQHNFVVNHISRVESVMGNGERVTDIVIIASRS